MKKHQPNTRRGAAFLLLVVALLLVVIGATQAMLRAEVTSQRNQRERSQLNTLTRAMTIAQSTQTDWQQSIRFPIDRQLDQSIVISANADKTALTATWKMGDKDGRSITRPRNPTTSATAEN
ncbi:MAG: hypothetical protein HKN47_25235 [Pirellulaceae bacterium]|nr:hypothetical protein [Pirellulaceae bacterium]